MAAWALGLFALWQALAVFFAPVLIIAYRVRWLGIDDFLGGQLPGDQYRRFVPLMNATPAWEMALWIAVGLVYWVLAWRLLRNRPGAFVLFAGGLLLAYATASAGWLDRQFHPALAEIYRHTYAFPKPNFRRDYLLPVASRVLPLLVAAALWWRERRVGRPTA